MDNILPFLLGSSLTLLAYPLARVGYRLTPYLRTSTSRLLTAPNGYVLVAGSTDGIGLHFTKRLS